MKTLSKIIISSIAVFSLSSVASAGANCNLGGKGYNLSNSTGNYKPSSFSRDMTKCGEQVPTRNWQCSWVSADNSWIIPSQRVVIFTADKWGAQKYNVFSYSTVRNKGCKDPESFESGDGMPSGDSGEWRDMDVDMDSGMDMDISMTDDMSDMMIDTMDGMNGHDMEVHSNKKFHSINGKKAEYFEFQFTLNNRFYVFEAYPTLHKGVFKTVIKEFKRAYNKYVFVQVVSGQMSSDTMN